LSDLSFLFSGLFAEPDLPTRQKGVDCQKKGISDHKLQQNAIYLDKEN
jgi:hypothetical protein